MSDQRPFVQTALLGTRRAAVPPVDDELAAVLKLESDQPATALLAAAGAQAFHEQAGTLPAVWDDSAESSIAPPDTRPQCNARTTRFLTTMLEGSLRTSLPEFLTALNERQLRAPERQLPALLAHGARHAPQRADIVTVLGARGVWLAGHNSAWAYASAEGQSWPGLTAQWRRGDLNARLALLQQWRETDPAVGRNLLALTWKRDPDNTRLRQLRALKTGLSLDDEPLLEAALDDRYHLVRREAATLLSALPQSRFGKRMIDNIGRIVAWTPDQPTQITLTFSDLTPAMLRDGVPQNADLKLARLREKQIVHMLGAVALDHWTTTWQTSPDAIIAAIDTTRWQRTLTTGFTHAALRQRQPDWAAAILKNSSPTSQTDQLIAVLPPDMVRKRIRTLADNSADTQPLNSDKPLLALLQYGEHAVDEAIGRIWLRLIAVHIKNDAQPERIKPRLRAAIIKLARTMPTTLAIESQDYLWPTLNSNPAWQALINEFLRIITFRRDMLATLEPTT
ncbi:MAG: DUF5691 domain-containing protein [Anaerolineae bacterium]|nr:DUF5691 domain-containing protein [Anaerolineae bacterium]